MLARWNALKMQRVPKVRRLAKITYPISAFGMIV
jgi:hypothetical protein